jgi:tRNA U34 5-methylaminomethyl-2-thiouridine-forming methyltransferase MnmC
MNEIKLTEDGSSTLYVPDLDEHYHSIFGAITESRHVFIQHGLHCMARDPVIIFEVGFGTGLNALLACLHAQRYNRTVLYYAIEKYPLEDSVIALLNYSGQTAEKDSAGPVFSLLHKAEWNVRTIITPGFTLFKIKEDLTNYVPFFRYDLIFFDAFAPEKQPEMWTKKIFENLYLPLNPGGFLVTYCAKGQIKRLLKETGFRVEILAGPPGKRHMIRATKLK